MAKLNATLSFDLDTYAGVDNETLVIDARTREIYIPDPENVFGVQYDKDSKYIRFRVINTVSEIFKMEDALIRVNYRDSKNIVGSSITTDKVTYHDTCEFAWIIPNNALKNKGDLYFVVSAVIVDDDGVIQKRWATTLSRVVTPESIYSKSASLDQNERDEIAMLLLLVSEKCNQAVEDIREARDTGVTTISNIKDSGIEELNDLISKYGIRFEDLSVLKSRVDQLFDSGNLPNANTEITDIRIGYDGSIYSTAGNAVRIQISNIMEMILNNHFYTPLLIDRDFELIDEENNTLQADWQYKVDGSQDLNGDCNNMEGSDNFAYELENLRNQMKFELEPIKAETSQLKEGLADLKDKKITKFYASNQGETHVSDSDKGLIQDLKIYGQSKQDGEPSPSNPVEIKNVVNPTIKLLGSNILKIPDGEYQNGGVTITVSNGIVKIKGTSNGSLDFNLSTNFPTLFKEGTEIIFSPNNVKGMEQNSCFLDFSNSNTIDFSISNNNTNTPYTIKENDAKYPFNLYIRIAKGGTYDETWKPQILIGKTINSFKPYTEQTITLPITLNAIPTSSGGNVTIDGQQYIADYVDVERGKVIRKVNKLILTGQENWLMGFDNWKTYPHCFRADILKKDILQGNAMNEKYQWYEKKANIDLNSLNAPYDKCIAISDSRFSTVEEFTNELKKQNSNGTPLIVYYVTDTPQEESLSLEKIELLKSLSTYYSITNVTVDSEKIDGYTVFNYPISLANGWNYVKQQLNDNRDYIYDMDLQSAEAYVNSEYAVTLTELEV